MPSLPDVPDTLRGLTALGSRDDLNLRPVLLRVVTDLFVMKAHHSPDEVRQFEEIILNMLGDIDGETQAVIAGKLAVYGETPPIIIERLIACGGMAAAVLLEKSRTAGARMLIDTACFGEEALAAAVARRRDLEPEVVQILAGRTESTVLVALAENLSIQMSHPIFGSLVRRARRDSLLAVALLSRADDADEREALFLAADTGERAAIILAAKRRALGRPAQISAPPDGLLLERLEKLALQPGRRPFAAALAAATGARTEDLNKVVYDSGGEPLALVLAALGMAPEAATRIFLAGDPIIAHCYPRIAALRQLVGDISQPTARRLVSRFLDLARRPSQYLPVTDAEANATPSRGAPMSSYARARTAQPSDGRLRRFTDRARR